MAFDNPARHSLQEVVDNAGMGSIHNEFKFHGWEADRVGAVIRGNADMILETITRARTHLCVILFGEGNWARLAKKYFEQAAERDLIQLFPSETKDIGQVDWATID